MAYQTREELKAENDALKEQLSGAGEAVAVKQENDELQKQLQAAREELAKASVPIEAVEREISDVPPLDTLQGEMAEIKKMIATLASRDAKNVPSSIRTPVLEDADEYVGQHGDAEFKDAAGLGETDSVLLAAKPEDITEEGKEKLETLKMMEEMVTIQVHGSSLPDLPRVFEVCNGGVSVVLAYDQVAKVKRKFVEVMARAKETTYANVEYTRPDGIRAVKWPSRTGLRYPFSVIEDPNPRGAQWLQSVLAQA